MTSTRMRKFAANARMMSEALVILNCMALPFFMADLLPNGTLYLTVAIYISFCGLLDAPSDFRGTAREEKSAALFEAEGVA